jgi:hypothetical protein
MGNKIGDFYDKFKIERDNIVKKFNIPKCVVGDEFSFDETEDPYTYITTNTDNELEDFVKKDISGKLSHQIIEKLKQFDRIEVAWVDSFASREGWIDLEDYDFEDHKRKTISLKSSGYLVHKDDTNIYFTGTVGSYIKDDNYDTACDIMSIPIVAILNIKTI